MLRTAMARTCLILLALTACSDRDRMLPDGGSGVLLLGDARNEAMHTDVVSGILVDGFMVDRRAPGDRPVNDDLLSIDVVSPDVSLPDGAVPDDLGAVDVSMPDVELPDVRVSEVDVPDVAPIDTGVIEHDAGFPSDRSVDAGMADVPRDLGGVDVPRDLGMVDVPRDLGGVDVPRDLGTSDVPPDLGAIDVLSDLGATDVSRDLGAIDVPSDLGATDVSSDTGVADVPRDVGVMDAPRESAVDGGIPRDPVTYTGTFPVRTDGRTFRVTLRVTVAGRVSEPRDVWLRLPRVIVAGAPVLLAFHGTNSDGQVVIDESGAPTLADRDGVIVIAPTSRWFGSEGADFDHPGGNGTYWETANDPNPNTNEDLVLVRACIEEARRAYAIDATRVYALGHSNGGFMAYMVAQVLRDRVVGFASNAGGLSRCNPQQSCRFQGRGASCSALAVQTGWCSCTGPELPVPVPVAMRPSPAVLFHGTLDPLVSVYHTCTLDSLLRARGHTVTLTLFDGGGHSNFVTFAPTSWTTLSRYRLMP